MKSISTRLERLENAPHNAIPRFHVEFLDGHKETVYGNTVIRYRDKVKRITYDGKNQSAVDGAALYAAMYPGIEILPT